jgi:membrane protein
MPSTAASPSEITQRGWSAVLRRAWHAIAAQNVSLMAAGIAFYVVWALFPALVAAVVLGGLLLGHDEVLHLLSLLRIELPKGVDSLVVGQLAAITRQSRGFSSLTLIGALLLALWSATRG